MPKHKWKTPDWIKKYLPHLNNTGCTTPEHAMNCSGRECNVIINAPKALLCIVVSSQIKLLEALHQGGHLA